MSDKKPVGRPPMHVKDRKRAGMSTITFNIPTDEKLMIEEMAARLGMTINATMRHIFLDLMPLYDARFMDLQDKQGIKYVMIMPTNRGKTT